MSNLLGSSCWSSGRRLAEYVSALMPFTMESAKVTRPRMNGQPSTGCLSFTRLRGSTFSVSPFSVRQTMACLSGPRMRMPSISAWPPIEVRKQTWLLSFFAIGISFAY